MEVDTTSDSDIISFMSRSISSTPLIEDIMNHSVDNLRVKKDQINQEKFKCEHEMLGEIESKSEE